MADTKLSAETLKAAPTGLERVRITDDPSGTPVTKAVTLQSIADLATAGINAQTGTAYTLALGDAGAVVTMSNASANTLTIPTNASVAFPVGTIVSILQIGAGATTVTGDTGVTVNGTSAGGAAIDDQYKGVSVVNTAIDTWVMSGAHGTVS